MNLSKYGFPYLGDGSEKWHSYPHIVPKNLDAIALHFGTMKPGKVGRGQQSLAQMVVLFSELV
jgi:hypothetical protein